MSTFKNLYMFTFGMIAGSLFVERHNHNDLRKYTWKEPPSVVLCSDSEYSDWSATNAVSFWKRQGIPIKKYISEKSSSFCHNNKPIGYIFIKNGNFSDNDVLGRTKIYKDKGHIVFAEVFVDNKKINLKYLLEHELGHALGFKHIDIYGNIMNPIYQDSGFDFSEENYGNKK